MEIPAHFASSQAQGIEENRSIAQWEIGGMKNFNYAILCWEKREAVWVDPHAELSENSPILALLAQHGFHLNRILLTHSHHDHVGGVNWLMNWMTERDSTSALLVHEEELSRMKKITSSWTSRIQKIQDGNSISVGNLKIEVIHTPGHSAGECCYRIRAENDYCLTGDTLFIRDCGRTDLPTGSVEEMFESLQKLKTVLAPETLILPGHHYQREVASLFEDELVRNPSLQCKTVQELAALP